MTASEPNVWLDRFSRLYSDEEIIRRTRVDPKPLLNHGNLEVELATNLIKAEMENIFIPTKQALAILRKLVGIAHAHSIKWYSNPRQFISGCYQEEDTPLTKFHQGVCFTGYAGCGKSEILKALAKLLAEQHTAIADHNHPPFNLKSHLGVTLQTKTTPTELLKALIPGDKQSVGIENKTDLLKRMRRLAYRDAVSILSVDEFQFATQSNEANSLATSLLLTMGLIGIPFVYAANFSLVGRLLKRNQEDIQRLLGSSIVLLPDPPGSDDWMKTLEALKKVAPDVFTFDPKGDMHQIYGYTAGIKRVLVELLALAYGIARRNKSTVTLFEIAVAYESSDFYPNRRDVEVIMRQNVTGHREKNSNDKNERFDLWCPIEIPKDAALKFKQFAEEQRMRAVSLEALRAGMSKQERDEEKKILERNKKNNQKSKASVRNITPRKKLSADALLQNDKLLNGYK